MDIAIENVIPMEFKADFDNSIRLYNGCYDEVPFIVKDLRKVFDDRVGTVLDTCHAMMTAYYLDKLAVLADNFGEEGILPMKYTLDHYFSMNKGICKLIHFCDFDDNGYRKNHGVTFSDIDKVKYLLSLYKKYDYTCGLTLEIREDNYLNCQNYLKTKKLITESLKLLFDQ